MPSLPDTAPRHLLSAIPPHLWVDWADGAPIGPPPHTLPSNEYGCEIKVDFVFTYGPGDLVTYKTGMQGHLLEEKDHSSGVRIAKVFIRGVTESAVSAHRWVPRQNIAVGKPWRDNLKDWNIKARPFTTVVNPGRWVTAWEPDGTVFGTTVTKLVTAFYRQPPDFLGSKLSDFIEKHGGPSTVSQKIIEGVKKAGLFGVLNQKDFRVQDLLNASSCKIPSTSSFKKGGIYARFSRSSPSVTYWRPNTQYAYVGKTVDFDDRHRGHLDAKTTYGDLNRNSTAIMSLALCILDPTLDQGFVYLAEQVFVSMLQTYRSLLVQSMVPKPEHISFFYAWSYFNDISREVFQITKWHGAVQRPTFDVAEGVNFSSPLLEYSNMSDKTLFIRTDADIQDKLLGRAVPTAIYRRSTMSTVPPSGNFLPFYKGEVGQGYTRFRHEPFKDGLQGPMPGTSYSFVIELHKDGTPHSYSWTRLPAIGPFRNWDQARSWAVYVEWEHPKNSCKYRRTYLRAGHVTGGGLFKLANNNVPGSLIMYAKSIQFLQWLCASRPAHTHNWIKKFTGSARVLHAKYNLMEQSVSFEVPTDTIQMISGARKSDDEIKAELRDPKYGIKNVDSGFGAKNRKGAEGSKCDLCVIVYRDNKPLNNGVCKRIGDQNLCTNCRHLGRPCCTWTNETRRLMPDMEKAFGVEQAKKANIICSALYMQMWADLPEEVQGFDLQIRKLESSDANEDDGDSGEEEEYEDNEEDE